MAGQTLRCYFLPVESFSTILPEGPYYSLLSFSAPQAQLQPRQLYLSRPWTQLQYQRAQRKTKGLQGETESLEGRLRAGQVMTYDI